jgi:hypothetical protein
VRPFLLKRTAPTLVVLVLLAVAAPAASGYVHGALSGSITQSVQEHPTTAISLQVKGKKIRVTSAALYLKCDADPALTPTISTPLAKIRRGSAGYRKTGTFAITGRMPVATSAGTVSLLYLFQGSVLKKSVVGSIHAETFIQNGSERCDDESQFRAAKG